MYKFNTPDPNNRVSNHKQNINKITDMNLPGNENTYGGRIPLCKQQHKRFNCKEKENKQTKSNQSI